MENPKLDVYLFFPGTCQTAMEFYKSIFGGELTMQTRGEVDKAAPEKEKNGIIHANLEGGLIHLMASDDFGEIPKESARISLSLDGTDETKLRQIFDSLSADGGEVRHPLEKQFWGDTFGDLRDQFGISWMVNIRAAENAN